MLETADAYGLSFLVPTGDTAVGRSIRNHGEFARPELDFLLEHATGPEGSFVDVGANLGAIALPFAALRPAWRVAAVEAQRALSGVLAANALNNRQMNVHVFNAAAGSEPGLVDFPAIPLSSAGNFGVVRFGLDAPTERIRMLTLDELAPAGTELIKIDVEGYEPEVLRGAARLLAERRTTWVVEASADPSARARTVAAFRGTGHALYWLFAPFATPRCARGAPDRPYQGDHNLVALPPGVANGWGLSPVTGDDLPAPSVEIFPYLARYGYA